MKVIATNRNKKDFQSMTFETDLGWENLKDCIIKRIDIEKHIFKGTMIGIGETYPRSDSQQVLIDDDIHFSIKYSRFKSEVLKNYEVIHELYKVGE